MSALSALLFDLDGTLVQTERLKAESYARAAVELRGTEVEAEEVIEAFKDVVGRSREEVARALLSRFALAEASRRRMAELGVSTPWEAFVEVRLRHYRSLLADAAVLRRSRWPHAIALLREARRSFCKVGLATMSHREQVERVLTVLHLRSAFDAIATREDVRRGKPDPEIYRLLASRLEVPAAACLVIEDSLAGIRAALAAGMTCVAVTTPFTRATVHAAGVLPAERTVDDHERLAPVVAGLLGDGPRGAPESSERA